METNEVQTFRKMVMPGDLNPGNSLFGGQIMKWADEAAALYVMCQLQSRNVVTLKVSEILFKEPVKCGDILVFYATTAKVGRTSLTVHLEVRRKQIEDPTAERPVVLSCDFVFVSVDGNGKSTPHRLAPAT